MDEATRRRLLARARRSSNALGKEMVERVEVGGETVSPKELVFACDDLDAVPPELREAVDDALTTLRRERLARIQRLEDDAIDRETGEALVDAVHALDRAINALEGLDEPGLGERVRRERIQRADKLRSLLERVG